MTSENYNKVYKKGRISEMNNGTDMLWIPLERGCFKLSSDICPISVAFLVFEIWPFKESGPS